MGAPSAAIRPAWAMVDKGLSGQRFPCHVQPQADELLSSWLTRLSLAHGLQPRTFCAILWPATPVDMKRSRPRGHPRHARPTGPENGDSHQRAFATTLRAYAGTLWEGWARTAPAPGSCRARDTASAKAGRGCSTARNACEPTPRPTSGAAGAWAS